MKIFVGSNMKLRTESKKKYYKIVKAFRRMKECQEKKPNPYTYYK